MSSPSTRIVFVSGLSGSGRSTTMAALEDLSFYCVDNLPPQLVSQFLALCTHATPAIEKIALAVDAREERFLSVLPEVLAELRDGGTSIEMIFLDCADEILEKRYRETRRVHPLSPTSVVDGIESERALLADVAALADFRIDTSSLNVHQLRETVTQHISGETRNTVVNILSFGFRNGPPRSAELLFDLRFLPNPYWDIQLRQLTGMDPPVIDYLDNRSSVQNMYTDILTFLEKWIPRYIDFNRNYLTIALGCTGGQHRSVYLAEKLATELKQKFDHVLTRHNELPCDKKNT